MANKTVLLCSAAALLGNAGMFGIVGYLPTLFQNIYHVGPTASGLLLLPLTVGLVGFGIVAGRIVARTGRFKSILVTGAGIATIGMGLLSTISSTTPIVVVELFIFVTAAGLGLYSQLLIVLPQNTAPNSQVGTITAFVTFAREIGVTIGVAILGALFGSRLAAALASNPVSTEQAYEGAFMPLLVGLTVMYAATIVVIAFIPATAIPKTSIPDELKS